MFLQTGKIHKRMLAFFCLCSSTLALFGIYTLPVFNNSLYFIKYLLSFTSLFFFLIYVAPLLFLVYIQGVVNSYNLHQEHYTIKKHSSLLVKLFFCLHDFLIMTTITTVTVVIIKKFKAPITTPTVDLAVVQKET